ncbi:hypothetical protein M5K25_006283 [Dendrobium thyrsiflorum]|uniref:Retrovirus-related Pol polyprotein from transposon TNT 1-94 n=1 Tax=Dendrobium thyrsiflorum TaxID=117978 RepID=A0ABD0VAT6_DENTH
MKDLPMQQYLSQIKNIVDNIAASGSTVDQEDIILYTLNGLPSTYNLFKTSICTSPLPIDLDTLYSLLCSEEIHVNQEILKDNSTSSAAIAFYASPSNSSRERSQKRPPKNRSIQFRPPSPSLPPPHPANSNAPRPSVITPASSGGTPAELQRLVAIQRNSDVRWRSGGTLASGGGPAKLRRQVAVQQNSGVRWWSGGTTAVVDEESLPSLLLFFSSCFGSALMGNEGSIYSFLSGMTSK